MPTDSRITEVFAWQIIDSRGRPTVACEITTASGVRGAASVPSGASTGTHEAHELRDGGPRFDGLGVLHAVAHANGEIRDAVLGADVLDQQHLDSLMRSVDGTENLSRLGANAVLAVSIAAAVTSARVTGQELYRHLLDGDEPLMPLPMVNIISGGAHAGAAIDIQDFLAVPNGAQTFSEGLEWILRVRAATAELFREAGYFSALVADEGGLAANLPSNAAALDFLTRGIERAGFRPLDQISIAVDVAATQLFDPKTGAYTLASESRTLTGSELGTELESWIAKYPIVSIEDAFAEDDWDAWKSFQRETKLPQLLGDDMLVTNPDRLRRAIDQRAANAVLVKPNQIGTLSSALEVVRTAHSAGFNTVLSARSGETEDSWLSDLAVGWRTAQIKVGSTTRSERTAKWNRLLRIEAELGGAPMARPFDRTEAIR